MYWVQETKVFTIKSSIRRSATQADRTARSNSSYVAAWHFNFNSARLLHVRSL